MSKPVYEWGRRSYGIPAPVVGEIVNSIAEQEGGCPPIRLVESATPEDSPIHQLFTWDDDKAASSWRTHEARQVIGCLTIRVQVGDEEKKVPAFLSVGHDLARQARGEGYRPVAVVIGDRDWSEEALSEAMGRLQALRSRYESLEALSPVWAAMDKIPKKTQPKLKAA